MKKFLICLFILAILLGLSCSTAPAANASVVPVTPPPDPVPPTPDPVTTAQAPVTTPPAPVTTAPLVLRSAAGLDMAGAEEYTVVIGDFLSEITRRLYGDLDDVGPAGTKNGFYYPLLVMAVEDQIIEDPDLIFPGTKLKIPDLKKNLTDSTSRSAMKNFFGLIANLYRGKYLPDEADGLQKLADWL